MIKASACCALIALIVLLFVSCDKNTHNHYRVSVREVPVPTEPSNDICISPDLCTIVTENENIVVIHCDPSVISTLDDRPREAGDTE